MLLTPVHVCEMFLRRNHLWIKTVSEDESRSFSKTPLRLTNAHLKLVCAVWSLNCKQNTNAQIEESTEDVLDLPVGQSRSHMKNSVLACFPEGSLVLAGPVAL